MAEAYPANGVVDALNGTTDARTGLPYISSGIGPTDSPTYLEQLDRTSQRLYKRLDPEGIVGQSDAGALKVIVYAIKYVLGGAQKTYAGADNQTVADNTTNYVYLNASNALVINNTGYPVDITTFLPLATVVTLSGVITTITDDRGYCGHVVPQNTTTSSTGTSSQSWLTDSGNAAAVGRNVQLRAERGTDNAEDAAWEWDAANVRWNSRAQHSTATYAPVNATAYFVAGTSMLDANGVTKVAAAAAGNGLTTTAGVLSIPTASANGLSIDGSSHLIIDPSDGIALDANGVKVALTANAGLQFTGAAGSGTLGVKPDDSTVENSASGVRLKDGGTHAVKFANNNGKNGSGLCLFSITLAAGNTVKAHDADAPYKYRIVDVWSTARGTNAGTWKLNDGTNDITNAVAVTATDNARNTFTTLNRTYSTIAAGGTLRAIGDGALADVDIWVLAEKVA